MDKRRHSTETRNAAAQAEQVRESQATEGTRSESRRQRILLAVTGLSPQIVTETLYALTQQQDTPWVPDAIHLITTEEGAQRARLALFEDGKDWFGRLCEDYQLPSIEFSTDTLHIVHDAQGRPLDDIRSPQDNEQVADFICETVRALTEDEHTELHVSIAGGRKTMGYYLGYALSLFGRAQDRLSHVLVSEPFESSWDFFYPTPYSEVIETRDKSLADTRDAVVTLADIPFVRLRDELPEHLRLQQGKASFSETVAAAQKAWQPPHLVIDLKARHVTASDEVIPMEPAELAFYAMMARARIKSLHPQRHDSDGLAPRYLQEYARIVGKDSGDYERVEKALDSDDIKEWFEQRKSKTNKAIRNALGRRLAQQYEIRPSGKRPKTRFGLQHIPVEAIEFTESGKLVVEDTVLPIAVN